MPRELEILSAGAIEPGLIAAVAAFRVQSGCGARITWATTPAIRARVAAGEMADVVIVPPDAARDFAREGKLAAVEPVHVGRVGVGVAVRANAPRPDISTAEALRRAVLEAESVAFTRASSGIYVESLFRKMGILDRIEPKTLRFDNGPAMLEHLLRGKGREIGLGMIVEILLFRERGIAPVGPLPAEIQHYTSYVAAPMAAAPQPEAARAFVAYLGRAAARAAFAAHGIE